MTITIIDREGDVLIELDRSSRTLATHIAKGHVVATGEPLVFRLVREAALNKIDGITARRNFLAKHRD